MSKKLISSNYDSRTYSTDNYVLQKEWADMEAKDTYRLYREHETFVDGFPSPRKSLHYVSQGDLKWAEKTADHYKIEIKESTNA